MSPRRHRRRADRSAAGGAGASGFDRVEAWRDGDWVVREVTGTGSAKWYRCPGCDQQIRPATPHVVTWPADAGLDDRRHWHRACWNARDRRAPKVERSRNAPRYG